MDMQNSMSLLQGLGFGTLVISVLVGLAIAGGLMLLSLKILAIPGRS